MTSLSGVTKNWGDPPVKIMQKPNGWRIENAQGFNSYWFKHVTTNNARVLYLLASGRQFCCRPCLTGGFGDIWLRAGYCDVTAQGLAALPRNECEIIWSLPVRPEQPDGLFGDGNPGRGKATSYQVVEGMMSIIIIINYYYYYYETNIIKVSLSKKNFKNTLQLTIQNKNWCSAVQCSSVN